MKGPIKVVLKNEINGYNYIERIFEWEEDSAYLYIDHIRFKDIPGAVLTYYNPPVHQVGNPALDAYLEGLSKCRSYDLNFLILYSCHDPVHAGGDLKESLKRLDETLKKKEEFEEKGALPEDIDRLFNWADSRIKKGVSLHKSIRELSEHMRVVSVCGGGTRFGGSAEICLMADYLVGDSRSRLCFSEAMIGLIPGWSGIGRTIVKAGVLNARYMASTGRDIDSRKLRDMGVYNIVVDVPYPFPKRSKTDDPQRDKAEYLKALEEHEENCGKLLFPKALEIATCREEDIPVLKEDNRISLSSMEDMEREISSRSNPQNYSHIWGKPLREVRDEIKSMGRPLAPQSIEALNELFSKGLEGGFNEFEFVKMEGELDGRLYRDPRFREGIVATLEQRVAKFII